MLSDHHEIRAKEEPERYGKSKEKLVPLELELDSDLLLKLFTAAHEMDITFNEFCNRIIKQQLDNIDYKFENGTKPQFLSEN